MQIMIALISGILFGLGLTISQMVNPNKVLNFLDISGHWDPSLALVMLAAVSVFGLGYNMLIKHKSTPILAPSFSLPSITDIDKPLIIGAILFGLGWGLAGICPGPAISNISAGDPKILGFIIMMLIGMKIANLIPVNLLMNK